MNNKGADQTAHAGWSAPLLFAIPKRQVSQVKAHMMPLVIDPTVEHGVTVI